MSGRAWVAALATLCAVASAGRGQPAPEVAVKARVGVAGAARHGLTAPVAVEVDCGPRSGAALVRYRAQDKVWERPVSLSPGTRKSCELLVEPVSRDAYVEVCTPDGSPMVTAAAGPADLLAAEVLYTVVVARPEQQHSPPSLAGLTVEHGGGEEPARVDVRFVRAAELPEHWAALAAVDCLVIGDDDLERATPAGLAAVLDWTVRGGALIVSGGARPARLQGTPLAAVLPVELSGRTVQLKGLDGLDAAFPGATLATTGGQGLPLAATETLVVREPFVVPEAKMRAGSRELVTEESPAGPVPLIARRRLGDGAVTYLGLDLERSPLAYTGRVAQMRMWRALLPRPGRREPRRYSMRQEVRTGDLARGRVRAEPADFELASRAPDRRTPWVVAGFLALYWLLVGPGQYVVLRRRRALHLVWVVTPVLSVAFSLAAFGLGYLERGSATLGRELTVVFGRAGDPIAAADALVRLHAFKEVGYTVRGDGGASYAMPLAVETSEPLTVRSNGTEVAARDVPVPMWSERSFYVQRSAPPINVDAQLEVISDQASYQGPGRRVVGTITVHGSPLRSAVIQMGPHHATLGSFEPGKARKIDERLLSKTPQLEERNWAAMQRLSRRAGSRTLLADAEWWTDLGAAWAADRLELVGVAGPAACPASVVEPAVGNYERAVVACVALDYRVNGQQDARLTPGHSHRRTASNSDLSLSQLALSAPLVYETQLSAFPRPGFTPHELTMTFGRPDKLPVNVYLKHPVRGTWDVVYTAGTTVTSHHWSDPGVRVDVPGGSEYLRMPRALLDVKLEPVGGSAASGTVAKVDFEARGLDSDPLGWP